MITEIVYNYINEFLKDDKLIEELSRIKGLTIEEENDIKDLIKNINDVYSENKSKMVCFSKVYDLLLNNKTYLDRANNMSLRDLMLMITAHLYAPCTPNIDQDTFDKIVNEAIKDKDNKENCWRLAMNYHDKDINLSKIEDYFVSIKDAYYLCEYISSVDDAINIDNLVQKILATNDKVFIKDIISREYIKSILKNNFKKLQLYIEE